MTDLFKRLFCANILLETLSDIMGYDEEEIIHLLENPEKLSEEERKLVESLLNESI